MIRSWTEAMLVSHGKWRCLTRKTSLRAVVSRVYCCQASDSCMTAGRRDTHGLPPHIVPLSCYKVSPSHIHKQDTITDTQCGCPFVWFMGDVVAKVASVSFRGSGKLQIFPSQQEVQTWKEEKEGWWEAGRSWKEAGILEGTISFTMRLRWEWSCSTKETAACIAGAAMRCHLEAVWSKWKAPTKLQGMWVLLWTSHPVVIPGLHIS